MADCNGEMRDPLADWALLPDMSGRDVVKVCRDHGVYLSVEKTRLVCNAPWFTDALATHRPELYERAREHLMNRELCSPTVRCMADVAPRPIDWLWQSHIPSGRITLLAGAPGTGKSYLTIDLAARVSTGTPWPDGSRCQCGHVLMISAEDDPADTVRPRLDAQRADVSHVHVLTGVARIDGDGKRDETLLTLTDIDAIEYALDEIGDVRLIVVDPIGSFLGGRTDAHRDNEVRSVLAPIAKVAERHGVAVIVVAHTRKSPAGTADDTVLGSRAFTGLARAVWHLMIDPENNDRRLLLSGKCNLAPQQSGHAFAIVGDPAQLAWEAEPLDINADDVMASVAARQARERKRGPDAEAQHQAEAWVRVALADGPRLAKELFDEWINGQAGSKRTLERAKHAVGVVAYRKQVPGPWWWCLPQDRQNNPEGEKPGNLGGLAESSGKTPILDPENSKTAKLPDLGDLGPEHDPGGSAVALDGRDDAVS